MQRYRVRPWRFGDKAACQYANNPRRMSPPCGPPVAVVATSFTAVGRAESHIEYAVCEPHRQAVYDRRSPSRKLRKAYAAAARELISTPGFAARVQQLQAVRTGRWGEAT